MKKLLLLTALGIVVLSGCTKINNGDNPELALLNEQIASMQAQMSGITEEMNQLKEDNEALEEENKNFQENLANSTGSEILLAKIESLEENLEKYKQALLQEKLKNDSVCDTNISTNYTTSTTNTDNSSTITSTDSRYRKIYSNDYSVYKKDSSTYQICIAGNKYICIDLVQYDGSFKDYYAKQFPSDVVSDLTITQTIAGRKNRKCGVGMYESSRCYNENSNGALIMNINDQRGEGFHGGEYDPKEILKVIDF